MNYAGYDNIISKLDVYKKERFVKEDLTELLNENKLIGLFSKICHFLKNYWWLQETIIIFKRVYLYHENWKYFKS